MHSENRHLVIRGRVQGVSFRYSMAFEANRLGVTGWARNRCDGSVEAVIVGGSENLAALLAWVRQGPPGARVEHVAVELFVPHAMDAKSNAEPLHPTAFEIRPDA